MLHANRYEIEIRGRATGRVLRPVVDEFRIEPTDHGTTRLVGDIRDPSHLNGLLAHFTSMNIDVVSLRCLEPDAPEATDRREPELDHHDETEKGMTP